MSEMNPDQVRAALDSTLVSAELDTAWPNREFDPTGKAVWVRPTFLPADSVASWIGVSARNRRIGVYRISLFTAPNIGILRAEDEAAKLEALFARGSSLVYEETMVRIERVVVRRGPEEPDWYSLIIDVDWRADVPNPVA